MFDVNGVLLLAGIAFHLANILLVISAVIPEKIGYFTALYVFIGVYTCFFMFSLILMIQFPYYAQIFVLDSLVYLIIILVKILTLLYN